MAYVQDAGTRGVEARRVLEALGHVEHANASIQIGRDLAVDRPADAVLDVQRLVQGVDVGRAENFQPVLVGHAEAVRAEADAPPFLELRRRAGRRSPEVGAPARRRVAAKARRCRDLDAAADAK